MISSIYQTHNIYDPKREDYEQVKSIEEIFDNI